MVRIRNVNNNSVREVKTVDVDKLNGLVKQRDHYKQQRDSLIKDVEKLRKDSDRYECLTNHIKDKALHNPSVHRYIDLVHFIDDLERDTDER